MAYEGIYPRARSGVTVYGILLGKFSGLAGIFAGPQTASIALCYAWKDGGLGTMM